MMIKARRNAQAKGKTGAGFTEEAPEAAGEA